MSKDSQALNSWSNAAHVHDSGHPCITNFSLASVFAAAPNLEYSFARVSILHRNITFVLLSQPDDFNLAMQVQHARWADIMKVQKPGLGDRANCPSGGFEFAMVVWRYVRSMALAAKAEGLKQAGEEEGFKQANKFLDSYLQLLRVRTAVGLHLHPLQI